MSLIFDCAILTPENIIYDGKAEFVVVQMHDGEMGFLSGHMPIVGELGIGEMRIMNENGIERIAIEGGIVEYSNGKITILTEHVFMKKDLDAEKLQEDLKKLLESDDKTISKTLKEMEKQKLKARIKVAMK